MKRKVKVKLPFTKDVSVLERKEKLLMWAETVYRVKTPVILEEKHLPKMSYIVFER